MESARSFGDGAGESLMGTYRTIEPLKFSDIAPADISEQVDPEFIFVAPAELRVDESYQRSLSARSHRLIRKIVQSWNWSRFKPPVVVLVEGHYHIIDGQHTAIAALCHGGIELIPVMVVDAPGIADRAQSFVGHNTNRLNVTPLQVFYAELAAGDAEAKQISEICAAAGVKVLRFAPGSQMKFGVGDTMALKAIKDLYISKGPMILRTVLELLVKAGCAPVRAEMIKAVSVLLFAPEYRGVIKPDELTEIVRNQPEKIMGEAKQLSMVKKLPFWRALIITLAERRKPRAA